MLRETAARPLCLIALIGALGLLSGAGRADRVILAPTAETLAPNSARALFLLSTKPRDANRIWLNYASASGIELEAERLDLKSEGRKRYSFNVEYPVLPDLGATPAVAVGVRDLTGTGVEHRSFYGVATHSFALPEHIYRLVRSFKLSGGFGTGRIGGPFIGMEARLGTDLEVRAEVYRHRPNLGISLKVAKHLRADAYSLDGAVYYGLSFSLAH